MDFEEIYNKLIQIPWFKEQSAEHVSKIARIAHIRDFNPGDVFFREGDKQDFVYIVFEGRVALDIFIPHRGKVRFYTAEKWDVFGWSSVTPKVRTRTASAIGVVGGTAIGIDPQKLIQLCNEDPLLGYRVMTRLSNVITSRLMVTRLQLLDMYADPQAPQNSGE